MPIATSGDAFTYEGGDWQDPNSWSDTTTGDTPALVAPGATGSVDVQNDYATITGVGQAAIFTSEAYGLSLDGQFTFGAMTLSAPTTISGGSVTTGSLDGSYTDLTVNNGAQLIDSGGLSVDILTMAGGSMVSAGSLTITGFFSQANVSGSSYLQVGSLALAELDTLGVDSTSTIEVGSGGTAVAGELLIDQNGTLTFNGGGDSISAQEAVNNGTMIAAGYNQGYVGSADNIVNTGTMTNIYVNATNSFLNTGAYIVVGASQIYAGTSAENDGLISVVSPSDGNVAGLTLQASVIGVGEIDINSAAGGGGGAYVSLDGPDSTGGVIDVGAGQTIKFIGAASSLNIYSSTVEAAITGFGVGDSFTVDGQATSAAWAGGMLSIYNGTTLLQTLDIGAGYGAANFSVVFDGNRSTITTDSNAALGQTYILTKKADSFTGPATDDLFIAAVGTLTAKDVIDGGGGSNTLELTGSGQFNLAAPKTLTNIQVLDVFENVKGSLQNVHLRDGLNLTVNVADATFVPAVTAANRISRAHDMVQAGGGDETTGARLFGANDSSVFNLGGGLDIVTLGSATEVVNGKGDALIKSAAAFAGARITGGGVTVLDLKTGGTAVMNAADTGVTLVSLDNTTSAYSFTANAETGLVIEDDNNHGGDVITAGGAGQTLTGGGAGVTLIASASGGDLFRNNIASFNGETIGGFASAGNVIDVTNLVSTKIKTATFVENAAGTAGALTLASNGQSVAINLFGQFMAAGFSGTAAQAGFAIGTDGAGGTNVTYHPVIAPGH
jgi:hypothetical protein